MAKRKRVSQTSGKSRRQQSQSDLWMNVEVDSVKAFMDERKIEIVKTGKKQFVHLVGKNDRYVVYEYSGLKLTEDKIKEYLFFDIVGQKIYASSTYDEDFFELMSYQPKEDGVMFNLTHWLTSELKVESSNKDITNTLVPNQKDIIRAVVHATWSGRTEDLAMLKDIVLSQAFWNTGKFENINYVKVMNETYYFEDLHKNFKKILAFLRKENLRSPKKAKSSSEIVNSISPKKNNNKKRNKYLSDFLKVQIDKDSGPISDLILKNFTTNSLFLNPFAYFVFFTKKEPKKP